MLNWVFTVVVPEKAIGVNCTMDAFDLLIWYEPSAILLLTVPPQAPTNVRSCATLYPRMRKVSMTTLERDEFSHVIVSLFGVMTSLYVSAAAAFAAPKKSVAATAAANKIFFIFSIAGIRFAGQRIPLIPDGMEWRMSRESDWRLKAPGNLPSSIGIISSDLAQETPASNSIRRERNAPL
jgi:hypothetical protein